MFTYVTGAEALHPFPYRTPQMHSEVQPSTFQYTSVSCVSSSETTALRGQYNPREDPHRSAGSTVKGIEALSPPLYNASAQRGTALGIQYMSVGCVSCSETTFQYNHRRSPLFSGSTLFTYVTGAEALRPLPYRTPRMHSVVQPSTFQYTSVGCVSSSETTVLRGQYNPREDSHLSAGSTLFMCQGR